jgi:hypothetical protein
MIQTKLSSVLAKWLLPPWHESEPIQILAYLLRRILSWRQPISKSCCQAGESLGRIFGGKWVGLMKIEPEPARDHRRTLKLPGDSLGKKPGSGSYHL